MDEEQTTERTFEETETEGTETDEQPNGADEAGIMLVDESDIMTLDVDDYSGKLAAINSKMDSMISSAASTADSKLSSLKSLCNGYITKYKNTK